MLACALHAAARAARVRVSAGGGGGGGARLDKVVRTTWGRVGRLGMAGVVLVVGGKGGFGDGGGRGFHACAVSRKGLADDDLINSLRTELEYEQSSLPTSPSSSSSSSNATAVLPGFLKKFKKKNTFQILSEPGSSEVTLVREFGKNERIEVRFWIEEEDMAREAEEEEEFLEDEEEEEDKGRGRRREVEVEEEGEEEEEEEFGTETVVEIAVSKRNSETGVLIFDATTSPTSPPAFNLHSIRHLPTHTLAFSRNAQSEFDRRLKYQGPLFSTLDDTLQDRFGAYLEERGVGEELAEFVREFAGWKEGEEYRRWLGKVVEFVKA